MLLDMIYGWGNESFSAHDEYLSGCIVHALRATGPILECGSGLSTILIGIVAKQTGCAHYVLEHTPSWAARVQRCLNDYAIDSVTMWVGPLRDYGDYCWYDPPMDAMPARFSLVVCDGPPGTTKGGRYGLVPRMKDRFSSEAVILLDDAARAAEAEIARRWQLELCSTLEMRGQSKPYIEMRLPRIGHESGAQ